MKYRKFISQVKSIPKIVSFINNSFKVFLISLLILLFLISCKEEHSKSELVGIWGATKNPDTEWIIFIFSDGILLQERGSGDDRDVAIGKVADTFDSYPYTIKLTGTNNYDTNINGYSGTVTFYSATSLDFHFNGVTYETADTFYKYYDKLIYNKKDICWWINW